MTDSMECKRILDNSSDSELFGCYESTNLEYQESIPDTDGCSNFEYDSFGSDIETAIISLVNDTDNTSTVIEAIETERNNSAAVEKNIELGNVIDKRDNTRNDSSDSELFGCNDSTDLEYQASIPDTNGRYSNFEYSSLGSDMETATSVVNDTDNASRLIEAIETERNDSVTVAETNAGLDSGIDEKYYSSELDQMVVLCTNTRYPRENSIETEVKISEVASITTTADGTQEGILQNSMMDELNSDEDKSFGTQNKHLKINEVNSMESLTSNCSDLDNEQFDAVNSGDEDVALLNKDETYTSNLDHDIMESEKIDVFQHEWKGNYQDLDNEQLDVVDNGGDDILYEDETYALNFDDDIMEGEGVKMFVGKYECFENLENQNGISKETYCKNEMLRDKDVCGKQLEFERSKTSFTTEEIFVNTETSVEQFCTRNKLSFKMSDPKGDLDMQFCSDVSNSSLLSSQEVQKENTDQKEKHVGREKGTLKRHSIEKNDEALKESPLKDCKPQKVTFFSSKPQTNRNKSNDTKILKQQDIGIYFGLKPSQNPTNKFTKSKNEPSCQTVNDVLKCKPSSFHGKKGKVSNAGKNYNNDSSEHETLSGNNDDQQSSTANKRCPFYKKIPGMCVFGKSDFHLNKKENLTNIWHLAGQGFEPWYKNTDNH